MATIAACIKCALEDGLRQTEKSEIAVTRP